MRVFFTLISFFFIFGTVVFSQRFQLNDYSSLSPWTSSGANAVLNSSSASSGYTSPVPASGGNNVIFTNCGAIGTMVTLTSSSFNFSGKTDIVVGVGHRKSGSGLPLDFAYSINGGGFVTIDVLSGTTTWAYEQYSLPALDGQTNVVFKFSFTTTSATTCSGTSPNNRIDDFAIGENGSLPVRFKEFDIKNNKKENILSFSTASETNNDYFTIERSGDGRSFESIGEIKGASNSNQELSYEFVDESPLAGINYYRIKQTDFDGAYSYTEIRSVRHQTKNVIVSPNRTDGKLNVTSELDNYDVVIYNTGGQEVQRHMALSGDQSLSIETLQAGVYFVKVMDQTIRILKF